MPDLGRNDPCHCGSGKKYKKCCQAKDQAKAHTELEKQWTQSEKEFVKQKTEAESQAEKSPQAGAPIAGHKPASSSSAPAGSKHQTFTVPKFNMPRRTGGG